MCLEGPPSVYKATVEAQEFLQLKIVEAARIFWQSTQSSLALSPWHLHSFSEWQAGSHLLIYLPMPFGFHCSHSLRLGMLLPHVQTPLTLFFMLSLLPNSIWVCKPNSFHLLSHDKLSCSPCQSFLYLFQSEFILHLYG